MLFVLGDEKPIWGDLLKHVVDQHAKHWKILGTILGLQDYQLENIAENNAYNPRQTEDSFAKVLELWLRQGDSPTWGKLEDAIKETQQRSSVSGMLDLQ